MDDFIVRLNIERFNDLLKTNIDAEKRKILIELLALEQKKWVLLQQQPVWSNAASLFYTARASRQEAIAASERSGRSVTIASCPG
jgi:hypothetical protein